MIQRRVRINEQTWVVRVVTMDEMVEQTNDPNTAGLTIPDEKLILIQEDSINERVLIHELVHAYFHYLHLNDTDDMRLDQFEEIMANFIPIQGTALIRKGKRLTKDLQKLYSERKTRNGRAQRR